MAPSSRATNTALADCLREEAYRFDFFQAVRVLEALARDQANSTVVRGDQPIGYDASPSDEVVRFRALASCSFAQADIHSFESSTAGYEPSMKAPPALNVSFMGLFGPKGTLPQHFTRSVIEQNNQKNFVLRDFLDIFNHRAISLFYRAWEKHRLPAAFERSQRTPKQHEEEHDLFTQCLLSLVGLGTKGLSSRQEVSDQAFLYYAGHFSHSPRSVVALQQILSDYFDFDVVVQQFQGEWLTLTAENQSSLKDNNVAFLESSNNRLGLDTIAGERVWCVESRFRIQIGPVDYEQFQRLMPNGKNLAQLAQLVRSFVGLALDFDVQPILLSNEVPDCKIGGSPSTADGSQSTADGSTDGGDTNPAEAQLGYNMWLFSDAPKADLTDGVFVHSGDPSRG